MAIPLRTFLWLPLLPGIPHLIFFSPFSQINDQKETSKMKKPSVNRECPFCQTPAQDKKIQEICTKLPSNATAKQKDLLACCIKPNDLHRYQQTQQGEDPCISCSCNRIVVDPGSFLFMKNTEPPVFVEVHRCQSCRQTYELKS